MIHRFVALLWAPGLRELWVATGALVTILLVGTTGFHLIEGWDWFDSLYMVFITLSTVGYGEVHEMSPLGRGWAMATIFLGVGVMSFTVLTVARLAVMGLVEGELRHALLRRRMGKMIDNIKGHHVVCGFGRVGRQVARSLAEAGARLVVIESDPERVGIIERERHPYVIGNATEEEVLRRAGVERARSLAIVTPSDPDNLFIALTAKELNPSLYIISRVNERVAAPRLLKLGADKVMSPHQIGGQQMAANLLRPTVTELLDLATTGTQDDIAMEEMTIRAGSEMIGRSLRLSGLRQRFGVIIVAIKRDGEMVFNPTQHEVLREGDVLITIGHARDLSDLETVLQP